MSKELTTEQRGGIIFCRQRGDSYRTIAATIGCGLSTVFDTLKRMDDTGTINSKLRSGRPPLIKGSQRKRLKRVVTNDKGKNRRLCTGEVKQLWQKKTGQDVSTRTIGRALRAVGLNNCFARRKPLITPKNVEARLAWCLEYQSWTKDDWSKVMWSDESTFSQFQQSRCSRVWREPHEKWNISCVSATVKHSPSRMFWGCFSRQGLGPIVPLTGTVTGATHVIILRKRVMPTMRRAFPNHDGIFQEDNARPHKTKLAKKFHAENGLRVLPWPAQSPDLNPIENLWAEVKKSIRERKNLPSNLAQLERHVIRAWNQIPIKTIENLVDSMPQRIRAVIEANGGPTKY